MIVRCPLARERQTIFASPRGRGSRRTSEAPSTGATFSLSSSSRVHVSCGSRNVPRLMAERIPHPRDQTATGGQGEKISRGDGETRRSSSSVVPDARWNISDIFGMGHRSQRRGGGGHCLNLSPRIEVCLLTCIPS